MEEVKNNVKMASACHIASIHVPYSMGQALMNDTFQSEPIDYPDDFVSLTPSQSLGRFYKDPKYSITLRPAEHHNGYVADVWAERG